MIQNVQNRLFLLYEKRYCATMSNPTLIARLIPKASKSIIGKDKSKARLSMARLLDAWEEIIAPENPHAIRPIRVGWKWRGEGAEKVIEGTLHIAAPSAMATKLKFQEAVIIGRINRLFGMPANACVKKIDISHDRAAAPTSRKTTKKQVSNLPDDLKSTIEAIEDPVLKARLEGLAKAMEADNAQ